MITFITLKAQDCFSYRTLEFNFQTGLHSVTGENGSSKTSIFLTLQQGLFNRNAKGCKVEEVNNGITGNPYEIEIEFFKGSDRYVVVNSRKRGTLIFTKNTKDISLKRIPDTLKLIAEVLGCDYEMFCDLTYQSKSSTLNLLDSATNKGRAEFVNRILKLDELDYHYTRLETTRKSLEGKNGTIAGLREQIRLLEAGLVEPAEIGSELPEADTLQLKQELEEVQNRLQDALIRQKWYRQKIDQAEQARDKIAHKQELERQLDALALPADSAEVVDLVIRSLQQTISRKTEQLRQTKAEFDRLVEAQNKGTCYACGHGIDPQQFTAEITGLRDTGTGLKADLAEAKNTLSRYEEALAVWKRHDSLTREISTVIIPETTVDLEAEQIKLASALTEESLLRDRKQELDALLADAARIREHNAAVRAQRQLNRRIEESNRQNTLLLDQKRKELTAAEDRVDLLKTWAGILGSTGYRTARIARFLATLNQTANKYARMICRGRIVCRFYLDAKGEINFDIQDDAKTQDIALWSGGETARIKVVCLFALLELLQTVGSVSFNVLCLDEVFDALDAEGKEGLFTVLTYLRNKNKAIYTIAHSELALDLVYDSVIRAEKLPDGTTRILQ